MTLSRIEHPWLVSINFTHDEHHSLLHSKAGLRRGVQQRIADNLKRLDRPLHLFVLEQHKGRWHLHGVIGLAEEREDELRKALRGLAGKSPEMLRRHLVHIQRVDNGRRFKGEYGLCGWGMYLGKSLSRSSAALDGSSPVIANRGLKAHTDAQDARQPTAAELADEVWGSF